MCSDHSRPLESIESVTLLRTMSSLIHQLDDEVHIILGVNAVHFLQVRCTASTASISIKGQQRPFLLILQM